MLKNLLTQLVLERLTIKRVAAILDFTMMKTLYDKKKVRNRFLG